MLDQVRSDILLPGGRQGAVREPLHPDTLEVPEHAHASGRGRAGRGGGAGGIGSTALLVGDSSTESHHSPRHRARRTGRGGRGTTAADGDDVVRSHARLVRSHVQRSCRFLVHLPARERRHVDSVLSGGQRRSQPASVVIRPLSSCRHLLRRSTFRSPSPAARPTSFSSPSVPTPPTPLPCRVRRNERGSYVEWDILIDKNDDANDFRCNSKRKINSSYFIIKMKEKIYILLIFINIYLLILFINIYCY